MYVAYVTVNVKPKDLEKFLKACIEEGQASVRDEPDCYRFEILRDRNNPKRVCFFEVFKNVEALHTHWETPHFAKMWETIESMIELEPGETDLWNAMVTTDMDFVYTSDVSLGS